ncbi:small nucleolar ribonucleoprotein complex component (Utp5), putative [Paecilomyces variotii No. 5]|uniref:Small nucleolar ribonucleoprotein complex component (Utp5), putative n=1 Tax=Byssochlamys spectabilis (strain No. 5 / NBRC 109023) TaxID=1356009 RepID=V5FP19_BYSSN|nr:small nucleolar ribonucleoprotein complex component (Utp5), putative [Paecilomyces variotii No. 5]
MGNKKASRPAASKTSSASSPAVSGGTQLGNRSAILRAVFSPSEYQLALFASVIQGLDGQHLRIHDTNTGRLQCDHAAAPKETITSLDWGYYYGDRQRPREQQSKKKRKRSSGVNGAVDGLDKGDAVVAFGTSTSDIRMYSPSEDKVVGTLSGMHENGIRDFKFTAKRPGLEGWSIGGDNKLVQWDLRTGQSIRTINLPTSSVISALSRPVPSNPPLVCASQTPYIIDAEGSSEPRAFPAMRNPIHTLITSADESLLSGHFLASDGDRYINVFDSQKQKLVLNLVAEKEVSDLSFYSGSDAQEKGDESLSVKKQLLAAVTEDGAIELFSKPFFQVEESQNSKATSLKSRSKQMTRRADATLRIIKSDKSGSLVPVVTTSFQGPDLVVAYADAAVNPVFERVRWQDENTDELALNGTKEIVKSKSSSSLSSATVNGIKEASKSHVDESKAVVEEGNIAEDIEMADSRQNAAPVSSDEEVSDDEEDRKKPKPNGKQQPQKQKGADKDVDMQDVDVSDDERDEEEGAEPSFGELMRANASEQAIDVEAELEDDVGTTALVPGKSSSTAVQLPSGVSLSTVLSQALKTNDSEMLESCFHTGDLSIVRSTIQRLDSSLAATLLQRLAERLSTRPGRYGHLLVWVQWTCITHGGAIAGKADLLKRMSTLFKVMDQRSSSLQSLLLLKGKLDMLDAQLHLRQSIANRGMESDEDEDNIIYVEGQDDEDEDSDVEGATVTPRTKSLRDRAADEEDAMMNGVGSESEDEEDEDEEADEDADILDIEAEESAGSSDAEESLEENEDEDEEDSAGSMADFIADTEDDSEDDAAISHQPPPKKSKLSKGKKGGRK